MSLAGSVTGPNIAKRASRSLCFEMQLLVAKRFDGVQVGGDPRLPNEDENSVCNRSF